MKNNIILLTDSYKLTQYNQYPETMIYMHDYMESRGGIGDSIQFFGLQYYLKKYLSTPITMEMVEEANEISNTHGINFNYEGWRYIATKLKGKLPIRIRAAAEGSIIPKKNVILTIESTDENVPWVVTWVETLMMKLWYPTTVATLSYNIQKMISEMANITLDDPNEIGHMFHNFGYRGVSSEESAMIGSMAHLINFNGTDTLAGLVGLKEYYNSKEYVGKSIPASEHSTIISWTRDGELDAYRNLLDKYADMPISIVLDSYDYKNAISQHICVDLKENIVGRKHFTYLRPDSGDALENILFTLDETAKAFGYSVNSKGYKVVNNVRIIQGDGVNYELIKQVLQEMIKLNYSIENVSFGSGGALLQGNSESSINRDTHQFAIKCSALKLSNEDEVRKVAKMPKADSTKNSKKGRLDLIISNGIYETVDISDYDFGKYHDKSILNDVYYNGEIVKEFSYDDLLNNSKADIQN
jgi:nicotinamide phosphoribosyltransferase